MKNLSIPALCLCAALALPLAACGKGAPAATPAPSAIPAAPSAHVPVVPPVSEKPGQDFTPVTALDNASCLIRITGVEPEGKLGYTVKTSLTNRTKAPVLFDLRYAAVNGVQTDPLFGAQADAGETVEADMVFDTDVLAYYGIEDFTDIELSFLAVDAADLGVELDDNAPVELYPRGQANAKLYSRKAEKTDRRFLSNQYVCATLISFYQDRKTGFAANLLLENKTGLPLNFTVDDATLNDHVCDPNFFVTVAPGKQLFTTVYWAPSYMEESGVSQLFLAKGDTDEPDEEIKEIRFRFRCYDAVGWSKTDLADEEVKLILPKDKDPEPSPSPAS